MVGRKSQLCYYPGRGQPIRYRHQPVQGVEDEYEIIPNPDHPDLVIRYMPLDEAGLANFWPRFLRRYLPADWAQGFAPNPRYIYSRQGESGEVELRELGGLFEA